MVRSISEVLAQAKLIEQEQRPYSHTFILPKARKSIEKVNVKSEVSGQQRGRMTIICQKKKRKREMIEAYFIRNRLET